MTINELIEKRANLWKAMDAFLKAQTNEKGVLSAEDENEVIKIMRKG